MKWNSGALLMGIAAVLMLAYEWEFASRARVGEAEVVESGFAGRSGQTDSTVVHLAEGKQVGATLRA